MIVTIDFLHSIHRNVVSLTFQYRIMLLLLSTLSLPHHRVLFTPSLSLAPPPAQKIKHFAQRELELQKLKKERENRKAKYVNEAGGLKYTAIAMANRS